MRQRTLLIIILFFACELVFGEVNSDKDCQQDSATLHYSLRIDSWHLMNNQEYLYSYRINTCFDEIRTRQSRCCKDFNRVSYKIIEIESEDIPLIERTPIDTVCTELSIEQLRRIFELSRRLFALDSVMDLTSRPEIYDLYYDGPYAVISLEIPRHAVWMEITINYAIEREYQLRLKELLGYLKEIETVSNTR